MPDNDPGVLARECRDLAAIRGWPHNEFLIRIATYLESLSAPVADEEKVIEEIARTAYNNWLRCTPGHEEVEETLVTTLREYARRLRAPVGVTVGEPALTGLEVEGWQPLETHDVRRHGHHVIGWNEQWGEAEFMLHDDGWTIASFNGGVKRSAPTMWQPFPSFPKRSELASVSGSPTSPKQTSELEEAGNIALGNSLK